MYKKLLLVLVIGLAAFAAACADEDGSFGAPGDLESSASAIIVIDSINPTSADPGATVTIMGEGLNPETDKVLIGKTEIDPVVAATEEAAPAAAGKPITKGLTLKRQQEEESGEEEGEEGEEAAASSEMAFVVPAETPAGPVAIRVTRDGVKSNSVTLTVVVAEEEAGAEPGADESAEPPAEETASEETGVFIRKIDNPLNYYIYEINWVLPAGVDNGVLFAPATSKAFNGEPMEGYAATDMAKLLSMIANAIFDDAALNQEPLNYKVAYEKCTGSTPGRYYTFMCKPLKVTANAGTIKTTTYKTNPARSSVEKIVLDYKDATGAEQHFDAQIPY